MKRPVMTGVLLTLGVLLAPVLASPALATVGDDSIVVTIDPPSISIVLGEKVDLRVDVTNNASASTPPLVVHLDITDPMQSTSVDPEDWTPTLSQTVGTLGSGESATVRWTVQPISPGTFAAYAVALSPEADTLDASTVLEINVEDRRSLNPGGILPIAIAAPSLIGGLLLLQARLARRTRQSPSALRSCQDTDVDPIMDRVESRHGGA